MEIYTYMSGLIKIISTMCACTMYMYAIDATDVQVQCIL